MKKAILLISIMLFALCAANAECEHEMGAWREEGGAHRRDCGLCEYYEEHAPDTADYARDEWFHYMPCSKCGIRVGYAPHEGGVADCAHRAVCSVCGGEYGEINERRHDTRVVYSDGEVHSISCVNCDYAPGLAAHYGMPATCSARAVCQGCGAEYGEPDPANHSGKRFSSPTAAGHEVSCAGCGSAFTEAHEFVCSNTGAGHEAACASCGYAETRAHAWSAWSQAFWYGDGDRSVYGCVRWCSGCFARESAEHDWDAIGYTGDADRHWKVCARCGETRDAAPHSGGTTCRVCGIVYGKPTAPKTHHYGIWSPAGEKTHAAECLTCGRRAEKPCTYISLNEFEICLVCGEVLFDGSPVAVAERITDCSPINAPENSDLCVFIYEGTYIISFERYGSPILHRGVWGDRVPPRWESRGRQPFGQGSGG